MESYILYGLIIGLTSNLHCIGMCGPIALAVPLNRENNFTILGGILQYNFGRILTYSILGALVGTIGITANTFGFLQWLSIITGALLIVYAWRKWLGSKIDQKLAIPAISNVVSKNIGRLMRSQSPFRLPVLGGLNGLLPCGMVFFALGNALLAGSPLQSALAMTAFGLGTLPSMMFVAFAANRIGNSLRAKLNTAVPYMLTIVGLLIILRGLNLKIPFISPGVKTVQTEEKAEEVEMSCCHSKDTCEEE